MINFEYLPCHEVLILDSEEHVPTECPDYHCLRIALSDSPKSILMLKEHGVIISSIQINEYGRYLLTYYKLKNPDN